MTVGVVIGGFPAREATRPRLVTAAITVPILRPMDRLWWVFLGRIG